MVTRSPSITRRALLLGGTGVAAAELLRRADPAAADIGLLSCPTGPAPYTAQTFDDAVAAATIDLTVDNTHGAVAWSTAYYLKALVSMYRATGDLGVLDTFADAVTQTLDLRDSTRGVTDYRGVSAPLWRTGEEFSGARTAIPDAQGRPVLDLRYGRYVRAGLGAVTVVAESEGRFTLHCAGDAAGTAIDTFSHLSMDANSADYVVDRLYWSDPNLGKFTARDLRDGPGDFSPPAPGTYQLQTEYYPMPVDQGMILDSMAEFAAIAATDRRVGRVHGLLADTCTAAVVDGLAALEFLRKENTVNEAWYVFDPEFPMHYAGADVPHNHSAVLARCHLNLASATGDATCRTTGEQLLRRFRNDLRTTETGFTWNYWDSRGLGYSGWAREDQVSTRVPYSNPYQALEDPSHGTLEVEAALTAHAAGLVFSDNDMVRFAKTYVDQLATTRPVDPSCSYQPPAIFSFVDGSGGIGWQSAPGRWAVLSEFDDAILPHTRGAYDDFYGSRTPTPNALYCIACILVAQTAPPERYPRVYGRRRD